ncbi:hypothetical protein AYI69_g278 [Smittium culicis]|uniref:Potassium channel domain-containing protein n=1 Tax=Smittium culicis TaxID=133412 RepID=A0A1R1YTS2_9FUNG|nr:hypothetical protein AYI69_g278 [Smittium culicis]
MSTIGFGDYYPETPWAKVIFAAWFIVALIIMGIYLLNTKKVVTDMLSSKYRKELRKIEKKKRELEKKILQNHTRLNSNASIKPKIKDIVYEWYYHSMLLPSGNSKKKTEIMNNGKYNDPNLGNSAILNQRLSRAGFTDRSIDNIQEFAEKKTEELNVKRMNTRLFVGLSLNIAFQ